MPKGTASAPIWCNPKVKAYLEMLKEKNNIPVNCLVAMALPYLDKNAEKYTRKEAIIIGQKIARKAAEKLEKKLEKGAEKEETMGDAVNIAQD